MTSYALGIQNTCVPAQSRGSATNARQNWTECITQYNTNSKRAGVGGTGVGVALAPPHAARSAARETVVMAALSRMVVLVPSGSVMGRGWCAAGDGDTMHDPDSPTFRSDEATM